MKILTLNFRIHSAEYELFDILSSTPVKEKELCRGVVDKIGLETALIIHKPFGKKEKQLIKPILDHHHAMEAIFNVICDKDCGVINNIDEIDAVGHRVVHGGEKYFNSVIITEEVKKEIYRNFELAPLHNPYNFKGIESTGKLLPGKIQVAVFDTSFHQTLPEVAYRYPLPEKLYEKYRIRRYGFHGISHSYSAERTAQLLKVPLNRLIMVSLHLGQGSSLCAVKNGVSIDTTMGFTPLEGLMMTTRSGDICPGITLYLQKSGWTLNDIESCLNKQSGILGVSGISDEMKEVVEQMLKGNPKAKLAVDMYVYRVRKYLGAYYLLLGKKTMAISFTGGIGENSDIIRRMICQDLDFIGIKLDEKLNKKSLLESRQISRPGSKTKVFVISRNEKLVIAHDVVKVCTQSK